VPWEEISTPEVLRVAEAAKADLGF
jgi:hypothetical protein